MLTPEQIAALRDRAGQVTDPIVEYLIADIAERVSEAGQLTSTAAYQAWTAQKFGVSQKDLKKELKKRLDLTTKEINQLFEQAAQTGYANDLKRLGEAGAVSFDENTSLQQILDSSIKLANADFENITQTMGFIGPDGQFNELTKAYRRSCDFAFEKVVNGAQDYNSAVRDAVNGLAKHGIRVLDYDSGVHTSLEAAVRRNIMGGLGLMNEQITQQNHDDLGCDGWEISAHGGSAPDHEPIQGKQYSDKEYERLNNSLVRRVSTLGCRHDAFGVILGVNEPQYTDAELEEMRRKNEEGITYNGKHYTLYEAEQRQHKIERSVKNRKHRILIDEKLGNKDALQTDQIRLQILKQEYSRFSKAAHLPMQHARMEAAGFDWKKGKAAEKVAKSKGILDPNELQTRKQYERYKERLASRMSVTGYDDFFRLKSSGSKEWDELQHDYRYTGIVDRLIKNNKGVVVCKDPKDIPDSYHDAAKRLSASQQNGLYHYSHYEEGVKMNKALGHVPGVMLTPAEQLNLDQTADALNHMTLPKNTVLWRGTDSRLLKGFENLDPNNLSSWKMKELSMDGFTSTSILQSASYNDKPVQMVILAPENMLGAGYIDDVSYNLAHLGEIENGRKLSQEYEILLQKSSRFSIIEAQKFKGKTILVVKWEGGIP